MRTIRKKGCRSSSTTTSGTAKTPLQTGCSTTRPHRRTATGRDEHDGIIADTIAGILFKALPAHTIPPKLRFSYENVPALDAEILSVYCGFEAAGLSFSLDFELNTGRGGNRVLLELEPEPSAGNVSLTCEGMDDDFTAAWNPDTAKWDKPLPAKQQGK